MAWTWTTPFLLAAFSISETVPFSSPEHLSPYIHLRLQYPILLFLVIHHQSLPRQRGFKSPGDHADDRTVVGILDGIFLGTSRWVRCMSVGASTVGRKEIGAG